MLSETLYTFKELNFANACQQVIWIYTRDNTTKKQTEYKNKTHQKSLRSGCFNKDFSEKIWRKSPLISSVSIKNIHFP